MSARHGTGGIAFEPHPTARPAAFETQFPAPLHALADAGRLVGLLRPGAAAPLVPDDAVRAKVRDMLRHGGYKPTGRGKPASEYLLRAAASGQLGGINAAVDACNAASLHSGFPVSVIDLGHARAPFRIALAPEGARYVFNAGGQEIDLGGLLCLFDAVGPCGNGVKDAQRTKTGPHTTHTLSVVWGCVGLEDRLAEMLTWYGTLLRRFGAALRDVPVTPG